MKNWKKPRSVSKEMISFIRHKGIYLKVYHNNSKSIKPPKNDTSSLKICGHASKLYSSDYSSCEPTYCSIKSRLMMQRNSLKSRFPFLKVILFLIKGVFSFQKF